MSLHNVSVFLSFGSVKEEKGMTQPLSQKKELSSSDWHIKVKTSYYKQISLNISRFLYQSYACNYMENKTKLPNNSVEKLQEEGNGLSGLCLEIKCFVWFVWLDKNLLHFQTMHSSCLGNRQYSLWLCLCNQKKKHQLFLSIQKNSLTNPNWRLLNKTCLML